MRTDNDIFPFITVTFIFIVFLNFGFLFFGEDKGAFVTINFFMFIAILFVAGFMAYHKRDLPLIILPVTIFLLGVGMSLFEKQEGEVMIQINFVDSTAVALIGGIGGILGTVIVTLLKTWKDSKTIDSVKDCTGDIKVNVLNIEKDTTDIHKGMLSELIPGMRKLDRLDNFVSEININTKNSGGDVRLIITEVNKIVLNVESLQKELDSVKKESQKREKEYMGQIAVLRVENSQLKDRNKKLELAFGRRDRNQDMEL